MRKTFIKKLSVLILAVLPLVIIQGQNAIDYEHRRFEKAIRKTLDTKDFRIYQPEYFKPPDSSGKSSGKYFKAIATSDSSRFVYAYLGRVNTCRTGGCTSGNESKDMEAEYFDYFILFSEGYEVILVEVFNYQATYGFEITSRGWLKQFTGFSGETELKPGNEIDAISGATKSVESITKDVMFRTEKIRNLTKN
ncbi:MAG: FMN-binding protein [Bacteroidota bacterium]